MIRVEIYNTRCLVQNYKWVLQWLIRLAHAWSVSSSDGKPSCLCRRQTEPRNTRVMTAKLNDGRAVENGRPFALFWKNEILRIFQRHWIVQERLMKFYASARTERVTAEATSNCVSTTCWVEMIGSSMFLLYQSGINHSVYRSADSFTVPLGVKYDSASVITSRFDQDYLLILFRSLPFVLPLLDCEASCLIRAHRTWHGHSRRPKPAHWDQRIFLNFSGGWYNVWSTCLQFVWSDTNERSGQNKLQVVGGGVRNLGKSCFALVIPVTATICSGLTVLQGGLAGWFILGLNCIL